MKEKSSHELMEKEFVPYEIALKLEEIGFKEVCIAYWLKQGKKPQINYRLVDIEFAKTFDNITISPTWSQAFEYFSDKYRLYAETPMYVIQSGKHDGCYAFKAIIKDTESYKEYIKFKKDEFPTKLKARMECIKQLMESTEFLRK